MARANVGDAGQYKKKDSDIIEKFPNGRQRIRFKTVPAQETPRVMKELVSLWRRGLNDRRIPPAVLLAAWNLDFLCIHPFRDGNGRVSRLMLLLQSYHLGYEVGCYISLERHIEQNKVLKKERDAGMVECMGLGRDARWRRKKPKNG
jgi:Fic family protein